MLARGRPGIAQGDVVAFCLFVVVLAAAFYSGLGVCHGFGVLELSLCR